MEDFKNIDYLNSLYDLYKNLLTAKQQECFELYFFEDYSLAEIAAELAVTRNAIHNNLKKTTNKLAEFENKLMLYQKRADIIKILEQDHLTKFDIEKIKEIL